jgi:hypothetical protein
MMLKYHIYVILECLILFLVLEVKCSISTASLISSLCNEHLILRTLAQSPLPFQTSTNVCFCLSKAETSYEMYVWYGLLSLLLPLDLHFMKDLSNLYLNFHDCS